MTPTGYAHPGYAASLAEWGTPLALPRSGGWLLRRPIAPPAHAADAMGPYPLFACRDWAGLEADLAALPPEVVSVALVADPLTAPPEADLRRCFPDACVPFKPHYLVDLRRPPRLSVSARHRRNARLAARQVQVWVSANPAAAGDCLEAWLDLYAHLAQRRGLTGLRAFSRRAFAQQFAVPGLVVVGASAGGRPVHMALWYRAGPVAYYHLGASSAEGYARRAAFATFWHAIEYFAAAGAQWLDLGGAAGGPGAPAAGLAEFKQGWSTHQRPAYFCGRILDRARYAELAAAAEPANGYFPAYRRGEFF